MLTAKAEEIDRIVGLEFGADDYVTKPFTVDTHVRRLRKKLGKAADVIESVRGFAGFSSEIALWTVKQAASSRRRECVFAGQLGGIENLSNLASS